MNPSTLVPTRFASPMQPQNAPRFGNLGNDKKDINADPPGDDFDWQQHLTDFINNPTDSASPSLSPEEMEANHMKLRHGIGGLRRPKADPLAKAKQLIGEVLFQIGPAHEAKLEKMALASAKTGLLPLYERVLTRMLQEDSVDVPTLEKTLLQSFFSKNGVYAKSMHPDQLGKWNLRYLPELESELSHPSEYRSDLQELCEAALEGRYTQYLHDPATKVGQTNLATQKAFEDNGLDYNAWMTFQGQVSFQKPSGEKALEAVINRLSRIASAVETSQPKDFPPIQDMLRQLGLGYRDHHIVIPDRTQLADRTMGLMTLLPRLIGGGKGGGGGLFGDTTPLMMMMKKGGGKPRKPPHPELDNFGAKLQRLYVMLDNAIKDGPAEKLTIRRWQREPGQDLFQANDTGACIALGHGRGKGSVDVMQNTFVQLAEFYNHDKEQVTGKALFFWAKDLKQGGEPVLIINTFEGRDDGCEEDPAARDQLVEYAKNMGRAVAHREVRVYTADNIWNPLYTGDAKRETLDLHPIGDSVSGEYYFDTLAPEWVTINRPHRNIPIYQLYDGNAKP